MCSLALRELLERVAKLRRHPNEVNPLDYGQEIGALSF